MRPSLRKLALLTHLLSSVGWLGSAAAYLAVAFVGLTSVDASYVRGVYSGLEVVGWYVIVPFSIGGLLAGLVQSLGTEWGLFKHFWIATKFALTTTSIVILISHMRTVSRVASLARGGGLIRPENARLKLELVVHAGLGFAVLFAIMVISIYKPWGRTPFGRRVKSATA